MLLNNYSGFEIKNPYYDVIYRSKNHGSGPKKAKKAQNVIDLAQSAARKFATPPPVDTECDEQQHYKYFCQKILPNSLPTDDLRAKILDKQSESESQLQLKVLETVDILNAELSDKKPADLFHDHSCITLYNTIKELQVAQHFSSSGWKVVGFPVLVPMFGKIFVYTAGVFHTRRCPLFLSWTLRAKVHPDMNLIPNSEILSDPSVDQQSPLVKKPTHTANSGRDWPIKNDLEVSDQSFGSSSSDGSVDSGKTIVKPLLPMMDANDLSHINLEQESVETTDSYLDISFVNPKRRLNLSRKDKIDILDGPTVSSYSPPASNHSTPLRSPNMARPNFTSNFKRSQKTKTKVSNPGYIQQFIDRWFRNQMVNLTAELKNELDQME